MASMFNNSNLYLFYALGQRFREKRPDYVHSIYLSILALRFVWVV